MFFVQTSYKTVLKGNSLAVQWLGLSAFATVGRSSISGPGTKILVRVSQKTTSPPKKTPTKKHNCAENPASPEQFLRVIWEAGFWTSP